MSMTPFADTIPALKFAPQLDIVLTVALIMISAVPLFVSCQSSHELSNPTSPAVYTCRLCLGSLLRYLASTRNESM